MKKDDACGGDAERLRSDIEALEAMVDHAKPLIFYLDRAFNFIRVNQAYADADGREPGFFPGKNHFVLYPNEENERIFRRVVETGIPYIAKAKPFEYADSPERGVSYWDWELVPIKDARGAVTGLVCSATDVSAQVRAEQGLKKALAESERANAAKSAFLESMQYELTGPLNVIMGFSQILLEGRMQLGEQERRAIAAMREAGESLVDLLGNLQDVAAVDKGADTLRINDFLVRDLLEATVGRFRNTAGKKKADLGLRVEGAGGEIMRTDPGKLGQLLYHLLSHAAEVARPGEGLRVQARCVGGADVVIEILLNGAGQVGGDGTGTAADDVSGARMRLILAGKIAESIGGRIETAREAGRNAAIRAIVPQTLGRMTETAGA